MELAFLRHRIGDKANPTVAMLHGEFAREVSATSPLAEIDGLQEIIERRMRQPSSHASSVVARGGVIGAIRR